MPKSAEANPMHFESIPFHYNKLDGESAILNINMTESVADKANMLIDQDCTLVIAEDYKGYKVKCKFPWGSSVVYTTKTLESISKRCEALVKASHRVLVVKQR